MPLDISLPRAVKEILDVLTDAGFEAFIVGGCVRDSILGRTPGDWDITTSAKPQQVKELFRRTVDTGIKHGTVTVMVGKTGYEVTTYRIDGAYEDGRHPDSVTFTPDLGEDLRRRDFTINAMAWHPDRGLVDLFGGMEDLRRGMIRCVGQADSRFEEDALRMMRAVRFAAQLSFRIEENTAAAVRKNAPSLQRISAERIHAELAKLLLSSHPDYIRDACDLRLTAVFLPEYDLMRGAGTEEETLRCLKSIEPDQALRIAALLSSFEEDDKACAALAGRICRRLKMDNHTRGRIMQILTFRSLPLQSDERGVRKQLSLAGQEYYDDLLRLQRARVMGYRPADEAAQLSWIDEKEDLYRKIIREGQPFSIRQLAVTGSDLMEQGMEKGPRIGRTLQRLLNLVIEDPSMNSKEKLLAEAFAPDSGPGLL